MWNQWKKLRFLRGGRGTRKACEKRVQIWSKRKIHILNVSIPAKHTMTSNDTWNTSNPFSARKHIAYGKLINRLFFRRNGMAICMFLFFVRLHQKIPLQLNKFPCTHTWQHGKSTFTRTRSHTGKNRIECSTQKHVNLKSNFYVNIYIFWWGKRVWIGGCRQKQHFFLWLSKDIFCPELLHENDKWFFDHFG